MNDGEFAGLLKRMVPPEAPLPDAETIWWRAQLRQRLVAEERATRPIRIAEQLACSVCILAAAVVAAVLTWN